MKSYHEWLRAVLTHSLTHPMVSKSTKRLKRCLAGPRGAADVLAEHAGVEDQNEDTVGV